MSHHCHHHLLPCCRGSIRGSQLPRGCLFLSVIWGFPWATCCNPWGPHGTCQEDSSGTSTLQHHQYTMQMLLRDTQGTFYYIQQRQIQGGEWVLVYQPFTTTDLHNASFCIQRNPIQWLTWCSPLSRLTSPHGLIIGSSFSPYSILKIIIWLLKLPYGRICLSWNIGPPDLCPWLLTKTFILGPKCRWVTPSDWMVPEGPPKWFEGQWKKGHECKTAEVLQGQEKSQTNCMTGYVRYSICISS